MVKVNQHIEIVRSSTMALSSMSKESCDAIHEALSKKYTSVGVTTINTAADLQILASIHPDLVFLGVEFVPTNPALGQDDPDKIWVGDFLDQFGIAYTGSNASAHVLQRNKHLAKQRVLDSGLRTSDFYVVEQGESLRREELTINFPVFVKPTNRGGGVGINSESVIHNFEDLLTRINYISLELDSSSLIEQYLNGREFSVAILKDKFSAKFLSMPIELIAPEDENGSRILSEEIKSSNTDQAIEVIDNDLIGKLRDFALDVFQAMGARDYGRIDIRLDNQGSLHFLETNLIPSLISGYGSFPKACVINQGLGYDQMISQIADLGLVRKGDDLGIILQGKTEELDLYPSGDVVLDPV